MRRVGEQISITGAVNVSGRILVVDQNIMIVAIEPKRSVTLRRFPASGTPEQWRMGGLPVKVKPAKVKCRCTDMECPAHEGEEECANDAAVSIDIDVVRYRVCQKCAGYHDSPEADFREQLARVLRLARKAEGEIS